MRRLILGLCVALWAAPASATVIDFTQDGAFGRAVNAGLIVTGVGLNGEPGPVGTGAGVGLGVHDGWISRGMDYAGIGLSVTNGLIDLQVDGVFTRLVLAPFFEVIGGPPAAANQVMEISLGAGPMAGQAVGGVFISPFVPFTLAPPLQAGIQRFQVGLRADFGPDPWLDDYIRANGRPDAIRWGFAIQAVEWQPAAMTAQFTQLPPLDTAPAAVPEPGALGLLGLGLVWGRRSRG